MTTLSKVIVVLGVTALLLIHPFTRRIILFLLPLGFKVDDIIVLVVIALGLVVFVKGWVNIPNLSKFFTKIEREERNGN